MPYYRVPASTIQVLFSLLNELFCILIRDELSVKTPTTSTGETFMSLRSLKPAQRHPPRRNTPRNPPQIKPGPHSKPREPNNHLKKRCPAFLWAGRLQTIKICFTILAIARHFQITACIPKRILRVRVSGAGCSMTNSTVFQAALQLPLSGAVCSKMRLFALLNLLCAPNPSGNGH